MTQTRDPSTGQLFNGGAAHVYTDGGAGVGQSFNREDATGTTTPEKFTWPAGSRPTELLITPHTPGAGDVVLYVCFDAPDAATAATWLTGTAGESVDSQRFIVPCVDVGAGGNQGKVYRFTAGLANMYYKTSASTCVVFVEAS